jgi:hypothetical protein
VDASTLEDEEAVTDVEGDIAEADLNPETPTKSASSAKTPNAPRFGVDMSPPDAKQVTRTGKVGDNATPVKAPGRRSPFDSWRRVKEHATAPSQKRHGESLAPVTAKKARI